MPRKQGGIGPILALIGVRMKLFAGLHAVHSAPTVNTHSSEQCLDVHADKAGKRWNSFGPLSG